MNGLAAFTPRRERRPFTERRGARTCCVHADASAAIGIAQRRGLGKVRHIQTPALWVQQAHAEKTIGFTKVPGTENPSDVLTKHVPFTLLNEHLARMNVEIVGGRAETAPGLNFLRPEPWAEDAANDGYESRTTDHSRAAEADRMVSCEKSPGAEVHFGTPMVRPQISRQKHRPAAM